MEIDSSVVTIVVSVVALAIAAFAIYKRPAGRPLTGAYLTSTVQDATKSATELTAAALTGAQAAEQLWKTGKIERNERLKVALDYVRQFFPNMHDDTLLTAIESAVMVVNTVVDALPDKPTATPTDAPPYGTFTGGTP